MVESKRESLDSLFLVLPRVVVGMFAQPKNGMIGCSCQDLLNMRNIQVLHGAESAGRSSSTYLSF